MNKKAIIDWLERGKNLTAELKTLQLMRDEAFISATNISANIDNEKVQTSKANTAENKIIKYCDYSALLDKRINELNIIKCEILTAISQVSDSLERRVLMERYIRCESWKNIRANLKYGKSQIYRLHSAAIDSIAAVLSKDGTKWDVLGLNGT